MQFQRILVNSFFNYVAITLFVLRIGFVSLETNKTEATCPKPQPPRNGTAEFENDISKQGDAVKYLCDEGFTMIGSSTRHCDADGRWSGERPTCEKLCSFPALITTGGLRHEINPGIKDSLRDTSGNVVMKEIEFHCDMSFKMSGSQRIRCLSGGRWDHAPPTCIKEGSNFCSDPGTPENVERDVPISNIHLPGTVLRFSCKDTFRMKDELMSICTDSGTWTSPIPSCTASESPECPDPGVPENGERTVRGLVKETYKIGTQLFYSCSGNYTLVGSANITCMAYSQWSSPIPLCVPNVISDCVFHCKSASATVLNVAERPLVCSLQKNMENHVILYPEKDANDNPLEN